MYNDNIEKRRTPQRMMMDNKIQTNFDNTKFLARIPQTVYQTKNPDLKRHYPEMWGRDLDNHYDP